MPKCQLCGQKGLFLKLDSSGYCSKCAKWREENIKKEQERKNQQKRELEQVSARLSSIPLFSISISSEKRNRQKGFPEIKTENITPKGNYSDFITFDTETTGLTPTKDRIIELSAIKFVNSAPVERFHTLVNPEMEIPKEASSINHITDEMVSNAPTISQVLPSFESFIGSSRLIAHNLEFDLKFLYYSGSKLLESKRKYIDTLEQAKRILKAPKQKYDKEYGIWERDYDSDYDVVDYKLDTLCQYYKIALPNAHRAEFDTLALGDLFLKLVSEKQ